MNFFSLSRIHIHTRHNTRMMIGTITGPETSGRNYHYTLLHIPEECRSQHPITSFAKRCCHSHLNITYHLSYKINQCLIRGVSRNYRQKGLNNIHVFYIQKRYYEFPLDVHFWCWKRTLKVDRRLDVTEHAAEHSKDAPKRKTETK
jgi:hypothetical protein